MPRIHTPLPLAQGSALTLDEAAARHVQVLRLQPGDAIVLFNGAGGEFTARVTRMTRSAVEVEVLEHHAVEREAQRQVHLALGMPANERMDWLIEKATELGVASVQPLVCERSVLRLEGERALRKLAHWQSVAVAACEQCGRNRLPVIHPVRTLPDWLSHGAGEPHTMLRLVLSLRADARRLGETVAAGDVTFLSGPEGGLSPREEDLARQAGYHGVSLGARVLRAETAPLAALCKWVVG